MLFVVVLYGPVLLITILVHEYGHAFTNKKLGGNVEEIVLWPLGGYAVCGPTEALSGDLKVALAGPLTHIPMACIWWGVYEAVTEGNEGVWPGWVIYLDVLSDSVAGFFQILSGEAFYMNLILLCFNLLIPAYPLDGGRIFSASLILYFRLSPLKAAKISAGTALFLSTGMMLYAIYGFFTGTGGSGLLLGLVGAFVFSSSYELWGLAKRNQLTNHPIFGRECYRPSGDGGSTTDGYGGAQAEDDAVPAQTDSAVLA